MQLMMYVRQVWRDPRLVYNVSSGVKEMKLDEGKVNEIWIPDTVMPDTTGASLFDVPVMHRLITLNATGHVHYDFK